MTVIAVLPGDGIGQEVLDGPLVFLRQLARDGNPITITGPWPFGTTGWRDTGTTLPKETIQACREADVILCGAVGAHPGISSAECPRPEAALLRLRDAFDLRISIRTVWFPGGEDVTVVRNMTGGAYGSPNQRTESDGTDAAEDRIILEPQKIREVLRLAADFAAQEPARRRISVDKASVYATSRLWRRVAAEVGAETGLLFENVNVDRAAYEMVKHSRLPSVIATEGIFGDILSDILCARAGSPAMCGSMTINPDHSLGHGVTALFEPAHGSSPHRTGSRRSNPIGAWLSLTELFSWCPDLRPLGLDADVRRALEQVTAEGPVTYDLVVPGEPIASLDQFNERILRLLGTSTEGISNT